MAVKKTVKKVASKAAAPIAKKAVKKVSTPSATRTSPVKKASPSGRTSPTKVSEAKKAAAPIKSPSKLSTTLIAKIDVGLGNILTVRGEGAGLSWETGSPMTCNGTNEWTWSTNVATSGIVFKYLLNDEIWMDGDNLTVAAGATSISSPTF